jgi:hypothetical protein
LIAETRERERERERERRCTHTRARALINGRATNLNTKKKKKKKNLLHSRAPYFIRDFRYSFTTTHSKSFLFFSPFVLDAKGHERSLSSKRGAASSPYFSTLLFLVPYSHERLHTKSSCFFLIVPSQKRDSRNCACGFFLCASSLRWL